MRFSLEWLEELCPTGLSPQRLESLLTGAGVKVEVLTREGEDWVFELDLTANRPDCLGVLGVAREVALLADATLRSPALEGCASAVAAHPRVPIRVEDPALCPRYTGRIVRGVKVAPSPAWLERRLAAVGLRPVNNVVDITNYVLFECGQPLHAFDLARLRGPEIRVRRARAGEKLRAIDDREYALAEEMLVIADLDRPVAVAGVMGGKDSEVRGDTADLLIESALFDSFAVRRTSRRLGLSSASSHRFERGVDPERVPWASQRAVDLLVKFAGGRPDGDLVDLNAVRTAPRSATLRLARLHHVLGSTIEPAVVHRILAGLGLEPRETSPGTITVTIPTGRADLALEEDLIEEVARIHGYDKIPTRANLGLTVVRESKPDLVRREARTTLLGCGCTEVLTTSFAETGEADDFPFWTNGPALAALNPQGGVEKHLRRSLVPALLHVASFQESAQSGGAWFEIAKVYHAPGAASVPVGASLHGAGEPGERTVVALADRAGFLAAKGAIEALLERLGLAGGWRLEAADLPGLHPGRSARLLLEGAPIGFIGDVDPPQLQKYGLRHGVAVLEADFGTLTERAELGRVYRPFSRYPEVPRDLAFLLPDGVTWEAIEKQVRGLGLPHLGEVTCFDVYRGKGIPDGHKSLAFRLVFRAPDRTLTGVEVEESVRRAASAVVQTFQARQR